METGIHCLLSGEETGLNWLQESFRRVSGPKCGVFQKNALQVWASRVLGSFLPRCLDGKRGRPWYCGLAAMRKWKEARSG